MLGESVLITATTHDKVDIYKCVVKVLGWLYSDHEEQNYVVFSSYVALEVPDNEALGVETRRTV